MTVAIPYEFYGRMKQKRRTRAALLAAAEELVQLGQTPTIAEVAEKAEVAKSTAYRYFPSQEVLLAEVFLVKTVAPDQPAVYAAARISGTGAERLDAVVEADHAFVIKHEQAFRTALRVMIAPDADQLRGKTLPRRPANRLRYLAEAIAPYREQLSAEQMERLVMALAMCVGMESILVMKDICGLSEEAAKRVKLWAAAALLRASLDEAAAGK
jgi:AcrR family transcriptional regulator